jgi:hypothetical protein
MKIATVPSKRRKDLIIIAILLIGLPILVFASYQVYQLIIRASVEAQPKNVALSNLTTSSVTVSWVTDVTAAGSVIPVLNNQEQSPVIDKRGSGKRYTHYVELTSLEPNTEYQFVIVSDSSKYTGEGEKNFEFKTAQIKADTPTPNPIHGSVSGVSGDDVMLFAMLKDKSAYPVSAIMPRGGNWIMDMSALRDISEGDIVPVSPNTNVVLVAVSGEQQGATVEGSFSDLFDSNGKLKDVNTLNLTEDSTIYSHFPAESMLETYSEQPVVPSPPPVVSERVVEEEEEVEEEDFERKYALVHDLAWIDMVSAGGVSGVTGEESIQIVNLTDTGFSIIWVSEEREEGYVAYGTSSGSLSSENNDERDGITARGEYYVHIVSLSRLQPSTEYFIEIHSGDSVYDNDGQKYSVTTLETLTSPPPFDSVSGNVEGVPEHGEGVLVAYIQDEDDAGSQGRSDPVATAVDENGRWILSIADSRTEDGSSYFNYTSEDTLHLNVITTFSTQTHEEVMGGVEDRDIEITLEATEGGGQTYVDLLEDYGVLGASTVSRPTNSNVLGTDSYQASPEEQGSAVRGTQTPKTGLFDNSLFIFLSGLVLVVIISILYILRMTKKGKKGNMKNNI